MASIRIEDATTKRLSAFKGKKSYTTIIEEMINFFETTGMRVTDNVASPIIIVQQESARLQKIIRAIENKQNTLLKDILERSNFLVNASLNSVADISPVKDHENYMSIEEVRQLMDEYKKREEELKALREENVRLRMNIDTEKKKTALAASISPSSSSHINTKIISECLDKLVELKNATMFDSEKYTIRKSDFNMCIDTIREELKK